MSGQLRFNAYNVPNRAYYGTPDQRSMMRTCPFKLDITFLQQFLANSGAVITAPFGKGTRNIQLGGKIIF